MDLSIFYTDPIHIILNRIQLKISQRWNYTTVSPIHKKIRFISYKYTMNPSSKRFTISSFFSVYIFSKHISLEYYCIFSLYKVIDFIIGESTRSSKETRHQLSVIWLTRHHLLLVTSPLGFSYQVTKFLGYEKWIILFELKDQLIIQHINLIHKHLRF
jgi:hypothetical protein